MKTQFNRLVLGGCLACLPHCRAFPGDVNFSILASPTGEREREGEIERVRCYERGGITMVVFVLQSFSDAGDKNLARKKKITKRKLV